MFYASSIIVTTCTNPCYVAKICVHKVDRMIVYSFKKQCDYFLHDVYTKLPVVVHLNF